MKARTILLVLLLLVSNIYAQQAIRHTVFFATDKAEISPDEEKKLGTFLNQIEEERIETIEISGHTDSDGSDSYNISLSKRRVMAVQVQLSKLNLNGNDASEKFQGETQPADVNSSSIGKQHNRRVEIVITLKPPSIIPPETTVEQITVTKKVNIEIKGDTIISYPQGTLVILPKKDYIENPNCISMIEYTDAESIQEAGLTTMASDGTPLISGGMFDVKMCDENKCITLLVPTRTVCGQTIPFTQWTSESNNAWLEKTGRPLPVRMLNEQSYYEMTICGSGSINCDARAGSKKCKLFMPKTRIKLKNGYRIKSIQIASDEPMIFETPFRLRKRKAVFTRTCPCSEPLLYLEAKNKKGETRRIEFSPLNEFDKREAFGKCKTSEIEKKILFFKIVKKTKYRKYIIRKKDYDL